VSSSYPQLVARGTSRSPLQALVAAYEAKSPPQAIQMACNELLSSTGQRHGPVALRPMLDSLQARRVDVDIGSAGRLEIDSDGWRICVRRGTPWRRARFTVAHELGHILICRALTGQRDQLRALQDPRHWRELEGLCNYAAAELLMPAGDVALHSKQIGFSPVGARSLYDRYQVSWEPLLLRMTEVFGGSLISWRRFRRHGAERETFRVFRAPRARSTWLPRGITARYLLPDVVTAAHWEGFRFAKKILLDLGERSPRWLVGAAVSLQAASSAKPEQGVMFEDFAVPEEHSLPCEVALFVHPKPDADWTAVFEPRSSVPSLALQCAG
jgi:hypothetical protein